MNVLVLSNTAADPDTGSGGVVTLVLRELAERGAHVEFVPLQPRGIFGGRLGARYRALLSALREGARRVRGGGFDRVICFGGEWGLFTAWAARRSRAWRLIQYSNGIESHAASALRGAERLPGSSRRRWFQLGDLSRWHDLAFRHADHVALVSAFDARYAHEILGLPAGRVSVLHPPLPGYFLGRLAVPDRPLRIGYCGSWHPRKNTALMAHDISRFLRAFPDWRFEAVGPGTEQAAGALDGDVAARVTGRGAIARAELPEWYARCSVVVLPSIYESFGLAAAEAMACGCAVVGSAGAAFAASLRHGAEVYLLESPTPPHLEQALTVLARDREQRDRIAAGGYARAQELTLDNWRTGFSTLLERA